MSEEIIQKEEVVKAKKKHFKLKLKFNKKYIPLIIILLAIPITVGLALVSQEYRSRASGPQIARIEISPGAISTYTAYQKRAPYPTSLSTLAYDAAGYPIHGGVEYYWSLSSTISTVGTLTSTQGKISQFIPLKLGCGQLTVTASNGIQKITKSIPIVVSDGNTFEHPKCAVPTPTSSKLNPLRISSKDVSITADDFYIIANGKKFFGNTVDLKTQTLPSTDANTTNIMATWTENGEQMMLKAEFYKNPNEGKWYISRFLTYDGSGQYSANYWNTFAGNRDWGNYGNIGSSATWNNITLNADQNPDKGTLHFGNVKIFPFQTQYTPTPKPPTVIPSKFITTPTPYITTSIKKTTINTYQDAFVRSDKNTANYGYGTRLKANGNPKVISYMKFNISPIYGKKIHSAKLRLRVSSDAGSASSDSFNLREINPNSWNEGSVTYNNKPALGKILKTFNGKNADQTIDIDVTKYMGTAKIVSYAIATEGTNELILNSREAGTASTWPQLIIEYQ